MDQQPTPVPDGPTPQPAHTKEWYEQVIAELQHVHVDMERDHASIWEFKVPFEAFRAAYSGARNRPNLYSAQFTVGSYNWRVLFTADDQYLSVFLDNTHVQEAPEGWQCSCIFKFELIGEGIDYGGHSDIFTFLPKKHSDRGYPKFQHLDKVIRALTVEECLGEMMEVFTVRVSVKDLQTQKNKELKESIAVKEQAGCVGLRNQGATCYLNSFLQTLYHLAAFRSATYRLPSNLKGVPSPNSGHAKGLRSNIAYQLAKLFYKMQTHPEPPRTTELTESFGWTKAEAFEQHDIQELARILLDNLETKMKGTVDENTIRHLFMGKVRKYVKCRNREYTSSRIDTFYDLQLQVKGCKYLINSLEHELKEEELVGENKYHCIDEEKGIDSKEDADMGIEFLVLPPVLVLHLRRFEYDITTYQYEKVNDYYEFPEYLDMGPHLRKVSGRLPPSTSEQIPVVSSCAEDEWDTALSACPNQEYKLYSVLVHSGFMHGGHYHAYIDPGDGKAWYRFNDSIVSRVSKEAAINDNYGGKHDKRFWLEHSHKDTSAYMLVYIKKDRWDEVVNHLPCEVPKELKAEFTADDEAEARLEQETKEAHLYNHYVLLTYEDMKAFVDSDQGQLALLPDVKKLHAKAIRVLKSAPSISEAISEELKTDVTVWPTTQWLSPKTSTSGYPMHQEGVRRLAEGYTRIKGTSGVLPLFVLPEPQEGTPEGHTSLVFIKEYTPAPYSRGKVTLSGYLYMDPTKTAADQVPYILEKLFPDRTDEGLEVYYENEKSLQECGDVPVGDTAVVVVAWEGGSEEKECGDPEPGEKQVEWAEKVLEGYGIDRSNVFWEGGKLVKVCGDTEVHEAVRTLNHPTVRDPLPPTVSVTAYYTTLRTTSNLAFHPLTDDFRRKEPATTILVHGSLTAPEICRLLAPKIKWPPSKIRLWSFFQDRADRQFVDGSLSQHLPRFPHSSNSELGYELLDYALTDLQRGYSEVHLPFLSPKLKVLCRPNFVVKQGTTVGEVLGRYHEKLKEKLQQDEYPETANKLIMVKVRNCRIESIIDRNEEYAAVLRECGEDATLRVEMQPTPMEINGEVPANQMLVRVALIELRGVVPCFHGVPFFLYMPEDSTCHEIIAAARNLLCLRAELRNTQLYSLHSERVDSKADPKDSLREIVAESCASGRMPSLGLEYKKRVQYYTEKAIKIHN
eukprot:TRINITY_DN9494_c0_g1_i1.p1 TRINITY_DN9494_c0_g1~~TRINITY_DN9494_c0_g1_i1.p1  ORF type:complete len:1187 (+),score=246.33 TRINITY_DN9494_c0_g1_i1:78-3638(+)